MPELTRSTVEGQSDARLEGLFENATDSALGAFCGGSYFAARRHLRDALLILDEFDRRERAEPERTGEE